MGTGEERTEREDDHLSSSSAEVKML